LAQICVVVFKKNLKTA